LPTELTWSPDGRPSTTRASVANLAYHLSQHRNEKADRVELRNIEVWTARGLVTHYVLFVISLRDRLLEIAGMTPRTDQSWMLQMARNLTDNDGGAFEGQAFPHFRPSTLKGY
jgi:hypothetical protein